MNNNFFHRILILPVGSFEYHSKELPPNMDTVIAETVSASVAERLGTLFTGQMLILPAVTYGLSSEHIGMPTTAFVSHNTYYNFVMELLDSAAQPHDFILIINGHGGNVHTLAALEADFNYKHRDSKVFFSSLFPGPVKDFCVQLFGEFDAHAGSVEASLLAFYRRTEAREYEIVLPKEVRGSLRFFRTSEVAPHGVIKKNPIVIADPQKGSQLHEMIVKHYSESVMNLMSELGKVLSD